MKKKLIYLFLTLCPLFISLLYINFLRPPFEAPLIQELPQKSREIILIPLDSRPPCTAFVQDNAKTAGINIKLPPQEYLDYYTKPGEKENIKKWLLQEDIQGEYAIISIDQLLFGGLLASREEPPTPEEIQALLSYLRELHHAKPQMKLYAFNVLPRMSPPASIEKYMDRKNIMEWSRNFDLLSLAQEEKSVDAISLQEQLSLLEKTIPPEQLSLYKNIYTANRRLNLELANLVKEGVIDKLYLCQDDGEKYSLPNFELRQLKRDFQAMQLDRDSFFITRGADEVALSILAGICQEKESKALSVFLDYNEPATARKIMPYMAITVEESAREKLSLAHCHLASSPQEADIILFISCGDKDNLDARRLAIHRLKKYLSSEKQIALVDLSKHFIAEETLFPLLLKENFPLNQLIAYAGWNTTSNSLGTALAQAQIFTLACKNATPAEIPKIYYSNLTNLGSRFLEDQFYLKDAIDMVNMQLKKKGFQNVYDLDLQGNYIYSNGILQEALNKKANLLTYSKGYSSPFTVTLPQGKYTFKISKITCDVYFPWPRTFEIKNTCHILFQGQKEK